MSGKAKTSQGAKGAELVSEILREIASSELTIELIFEPQEEAEWNHLMVKHHYLKEHRMVGESLRYVAKLNGKCVARPKMESGTGPAQQRDPFSV